MQSEICGAVSLVLSVLSSQLRRVRLHTLSFTWRVVAHLTGQIAYWSCGQPLGQLCFRERASAARRLPRCREDSGYEMTSSG